MENKLKVAYILHRYPHLTETFIMREMYWLREGGVEVNIFSLLPPKHEIVHEQAKELLSNTHYSALLSWLVIKAQLHFLRCSPGRYLRALAKIIWQTYRELKVLVSALTLFPKSVYFAQQMGALGIEHVHAHFVWLEGIAAGIAADLLDITFSIHPHAFGLFGRNQRDVRCEIENTSQVVTVSTYHRDYIATLCPRISPEDIEIVHYGVDTEYFRPTTRRLNNNPVRILSVGRLVEKKGYDYLIDACALLADRGLNFQCQIVGAGPRQEALQMRINQRKLQDRVILLGRLGQDRILELYQTSDIFALACTVARNGDRDGMPNVLIEAMACGVPVVTTPVSGIPDLVHDGVTGLLAKERDVSGLADALECLIVNADLRQHLGNEARQTILNGFQIQHTTAKMATIFRQVSKKRQRILLNEVV